MSVSPIQPTEEIIVTEDSQMLTTEEFERLGLKFEPQPLSDPAEKQRLEAELLQCVEELPEAQNSEQQANTKSSEPAEKPQQSERDLTQEQIDEINKVVEDLAKLNEPITLGSKLKQLSDKYGIPIGDLRAAVRQAQSQHDQEPKQQGQEIFLSDPPLIAEDQARQLDGAELLQEAAETFSQYLTLPQHADTVLALWVAFTWLHDAFFVSPMLAVTSPERECGKTTLLNLLSCLTRKPFPSANATAASLFRIVDQHHPSVLADEVDKWLRQSDDRMGIINSGWQCRFASIARCEGENNEVRTFSTWAPKALAGILTLPEEIAGRSIEIRMRRQTREEGAKLKSLRADEWDKFEPLRLKLFAWTQLILRDGTLPRRDPELPDGFVNRLADNWRVLFSIADVAGGEWPERAWDAALAFAARNREESWGEMLLQDIWSMFDEHQTDRLLLKQIVLTLTGLEERPWSECNHGKPATSNWVAKKLRSFGVQSRDIRTHTEKGNGFFREQFEEPLRRYCKMPASECESKPVA